MMTAPPCARNRAKLAAVSRSPVDGHSSSPYEMPRFCCHPGLNSADSMYVDAAVYGYTSVVTSIPAPRTESMRASASRTSRPPLLPMCTMCSDAFVAAAVSMASRIAPSPNARVWTKAVARLLAATLNISVISSGVAAGV